MISNATLFPCNFAVVLLLEPKFGRAKSPKKKKTHEFAAVVEDETKCLQLDDAMKNKDRSSSLFLLPEVK